MKKIGQGGDGFRGRCRACLLDSFQTKKDGRQIKRERERDDRLKEKFRVGRIHHKYTLYTFEFIDWIALLLIESMISDTCVWHTLCVCAKG